MPSFIELWFRNCSSHSTADPTTELPPKPPADHRELGVQQELFITTEYSPGSPLLLPNGTRIFNRLVEFLRKQYGRYGFEEVITPTIYKQSLWEKSGHWENYSGDMFTVTSISPPKSKDGKGKKDDDEYSLKPMNCPGHCLIFAARQRTYKELPLRFADFSPLHRNELSGALSGLTRVRRFHQDDGHIFCRPVQVEEEISKTLDFVRVVYSTLKLGPYRLTLSTRPANHYIGTVEEWDSAEKGLKKALEASGQEWTINEGDGAFYGPKIDIILRDSDGKEHQTATIQLDFQLPKRFNLLYHAAAPEFEKRGEITSDREQLGVMGRVAPVLIHRAVLGSVERLMALLIEHHNGKWPFWLNPRQVMIITTREGKDSRVIEAARAAQSILMGIDEPADGPTSNPFQLAVDVDASSRTLPRKVQAAISQGYGVHVTIGPRQVDDGTVSVDLSRLAGGEPGLRDMTVKELFYPPPDYETAASEHQSQPQSQTLPIRPAPAPVRRPPGALLDLPILKYMRTHRVILASSSPRRRMLLSQLGLPNLEIRPSTKPEDLSKADLGPWAYVSDTAEQKALDVYAALVEEAAANQSTTTGGNGNGNAVSVDDTGRRDPDLVIAADTVIVTREGVVLEKPTSEGAHVKMLRHLRDTRSHRVLTAVCCVAPRADAQHPGYAIASHVEESKVFFARESDGLPDDVIDAYVRTREGADKAGGYAVQGLGGSLLVEKVDGAVDNVIGLPVRKVLQLCEKVIFRQNDTSEDEEEDDE
ncbi:threonyl-tRNA synthetase-like protein [Rostrohypoxylon terebratum]|nr:threonyl-tRNA synthetase-like protein [Rostrohypoxylon terebratum]